MERNVTPEKNDSGIKTLAFQPARLILTIKLKLHQHLTLRLTLPLKSPSSISRFNGLVSANLSP